VFNEATSYVFCIHDIYILKVNNNNIENYDF